MSKKICKLVKNELPSENRDKYLKAILPAAYLCEKCGRTACKKALLCEPKKIKKTD